MSFVIILLAALASFLLGFIVFTTNPKNRANLFFFLFSSSGSLWIITNYASLNSEDIMVTSFWIRTVLFVTSWFGSFLFLLALSYPNNNNYLKKKYKIILFVITIFVSFSAYLPTTLTSVKISNENVTPSFGPTYILYVLLLLFTTGSCLKILITKYRKYTGLDKIRIQYMVLGFAFMIITSLITNLLFTVLFQNSSLVAYGPFSILILDGFIAFAIIRHRFLSITNFANNFIILSIDTLILYILFYGLNIFYNIAFGTVFTPPAYAIGIFIGALTAILIRFSFAKLDQRKFLRKKYDSENLLYLIRSSTFLNDSVEKIFEQFNKLLIEKMGIQNIEILEKKNLLFESFKSKINQKIIKKLYLYQEDQYIFQEDINNEVNSGIICLYKEEELIYIILMSHRKDYSAFDIEDIHALEEVAERLNLIIARNILTDEQKRFNEVLQEKLNIATAELQKQKDQIEDRYRTERDMVGIMGHELRTPLTSARGFLEIAMAKIKTTPEAPSNTLEHYLQNVYDAFKREIDLVQTMLSASHVDNDKLKLDLVEVDLDSIVKSTIIDFSPEAAKKKLGFEFHPLDNMPNIKADPTRTLEVTNNIVSNAIKYTDKGQVDIYITFDDQYVYFAVKDTGKGIPEIEINNIGKKFYRIENYISPDKTIVRPGGTGLGMYVVKAIMIATCGELRIESKIGEGSTFTAVFPRWDGHKD